MRLFIKIKYDGSKFCGFQRQKKVKSVQKEIEEVLSHYYDMDIKIKGAGRTDAGVHALGQTATFDVPYFKRDLKTYMNKNLNNIKVKKVSIVSDDFHARFSAKGKIYLYKIKLNTKGKDPYYLKVKNVDIKKMKMVSKLFIGEHDFKNFVSGSRDDYKTLIYNIKFYRFFNTLIIGLFLNFLVILLIFSLLSDSHLSLISFRVSINLSLFLLSGVISLLISIFSLFSISISLHRRVFASISKPEILLLWILASFIALILLLRRVSLGELIQIFVQLIVVSFTIVLLREYILIFSRQRYGLFSPVVIFCISKFLLAEIIKLLYPRGLISDDLIVKLLA